MSSENDTPQNNLLNDPKQNQTPVIEVNLHEEIIESWWEKYDERILFYCTFPLSFLVEAISQQFGVRPLLGFSFSSALMVVCLAYRSYRKFAYPNASKALFFSKIVRISIPFAIGFLALCIYILANEKTQASSCIEERGNQIEDDTNSINDTLGQPTSIIPNDVPVVMNSPMPLPTPVILIIQPTNLPLPTNDDIVEPTEDATLLTAIEETPLPTQPPSPVSTVVPTNAPLPTAINTPTTNQPTQLPAATPTIEVANTPIPTDTNTPDPTEIPTGTSTAISSATVVNTPILTETASATHTPQPSATPTLVPTYTPTPRDTPTNVPTSTAVPTRKPVTPTYTPSPADTNTPQPSATPTINPTHTPTPHNTPTDVPTVTATSTRTPDTPTYTPSPTIMPTWTLTPPVSVCHSTLTFEWDAAGNPLTSGQIIDDEWNAWGITVTTNDLTNHPVMIFDSSEPTGGDFDLGTPNQDFDGPGIGIGGQAGQLGQNDQPHRNVLIISEDGDSSNPNDAANGGKLSFTFTQPASIHSLGLLDIEEDVSFMTITTYDANGILLTSVPVPALGDNSWQRVVLQQTFVSLLEIDFSSSGALADIVFCDR